jgi:hypothetical protein
MASVRFLDEAEYTLYRLEGERQQKVRLSVTRPRPLKPGRKVEAHRVRFSMRKQPIQYVGSRYEMLDAFVGFSFQRHGAIKDNAFWNKEIYRLGQGPDGSFRLPALLPGAPARTPSVVSTTAAT